MDSNVSKNTNSHKFFKITLDRDRVAVSVSVQNLLKQLLLSILSWYEQKFATLSKSKLVARLNDRPLSPEINPGAVLPDSKLLPIKYGCPIGLLLASDEQSPKLVTDNLRQLLTERQKLNDKGMQVHLELVSSGWLNFYLDSEFIAYWLERSRWQTDSDLIKSNKISDRKLKPLNQTPVKLFQVQYVHARCCNLLRLGASENLITLHYNSQYPGWQIEQPRSIPWLDRENRLWFEESAEYNLLHQLLTVIDCWDDGGEFDWFKIALGLSQTTAIFQAECRFLGEIKVRTPPKAIARLGLTALAQYWLQKILREKLQVAAPKTL